MACRGGAAELGLVPGVDLPVLPRDAPSFAQLALSLPAGPLNLNGFSLGAACALRLAVLAPDKVAKLTLISAAAPLKLGDFLPDMAGAPVFRAARSAGRMRALTQAQSVLAFMGPGLFARLLARASTAEEHALITSTPVVRALQDGLVAHRAAYLREVIAYVMPWARHLPHVRAQTQMIHGTEDCWASPDMARALQAALHAALFKIATQDKTPAETPASGVAPGGV